MVNWHVQHTINAGFPDSRRNREHEDMDGCSRINSLIEGWQGDIASASLVGQEAAGVEVANTMEAGGLVGG